MTQVRYLCEHAYIMDTQSSNTAVGYLRVSGYSQISGDGFPRQTEAIERCARDKGITMLRFFREEAVPGKLDEDHRPAFQEMVAELLTNGCKTIVIEAMHRLAREFRTQEHLIIYLASKGLTLIAADTGEDITAAMMGDPMRKALVQIQGIFAELEKNMLVLKLAKARKRMKEATGWCGGNDPYGENPGKNPNRHPGEEAVVARIRTLHDHGFSPHQIAVRMNAAGSRNRKGNPWHHFQITRILSRHAEAA